jgi:hypothetical protein
MTKICTRMLLAVAVGCLVTSEPAAARELDITPQTYAACTGVSLNPDQFGAGLLFQLGPNMKPQIRPGVELAVGNGVRLLSLSGDVLYHVDGKRWSPYAGGGPGLNFIDVTDGVGEADGLQTKLVAHVVTGLSWMPGRGQRRYFVESRLGIGDTPDLRITLGMSF